MDKSVVVLRRLRYFVAVCEYGGFSRASHSIGIAQPSLTRQVKLLEQEVGVPLILRTGRGAEPTLEGRYLLDRSRKHLGGIDEAVRELKVRSSGLQGEAVLGVCPTIAPFFVDSIKAYLRENHPKVNLSIVEAYSGDLTNLLRRGQLDLSLTYRPSSLKGVTIQELFSERLVYVTSFDESAVRREWTLSEIQRSKLILPSRIHELRRIIDAVCDERNLSLNPDLELDSLSAVKAIVAERDAQYATILPYNSVQQDVSDRRLGAFSIDEGAMKRTIAVVMPSKGSSGQVVAKALADIIGEMSLPISQSTMSA